MYYCDKNNKNKNYIKLGNYIRDDTDFILKDNFRQLSRQLMSIRGYSFVFALMKCSYAAFGEQNKTDNDSKCQQVYKSLKLSQKFLSRFARTIASQYDKNYLLRYQNCNKLQ